MCCKCGRYKKHDRKNSLQHHKGLVALVLCGGKPQAVPVRQRVGFQSSRAKGTFIFYRFPSTSSGQRFLFQVFSGEPACRQAGKKVSLGILCQRMMQFYLLLQVCNVVQLKVFYAVNRSVTCHVLGFSDAVLFEPKGYS